MEDESLFEDGPRRKLERATEHLHALNAHAKNLRARPDLYSFVVEYDVNEGNYVIGLPSGDPDQLRQLAITTEVMKVFAPILGDFVHNVRGALDLVTWRLARRKLGRDPTEKEAKSIQFPITSRPEYFASSAVLKFIETDPRQEIEGLQPYHGSDPAKHPLALLHWLSNRDKHRLLTPTLGQTALRDMPFRIDGGEATIVFLEDLATKARRYGNYLELWRVRLDVISGEPTLHLDRQPSMNVLFSGPIDSVYENDLREILDFVREAIDRIDRFL
jgi:hypothetical protein